MSQTAFHEFGPSLKEGKKGEDFYKRWVKRTCPGVKVSPSSIAQDRAGIDLLVVRESTVQVKRENRVHETGNVFIETWSKAGVEGWAKKPAADKLAFLMPGLGLILHVDPRHIAGKLDEWEERYGTRDVPNTWQGEHWVTTGIPVPLPVVAVLGKASWSTELQEER